MSTINLLPEDYRQRRSQHRANLICMLLYGVVIASVGGAALVSERSSRNTRDVCKRINDSYAQAARLIDEMHLLEEQKRTMLRRAETSAALMERLPRSYVLAMLTNALPEGASLTSLELNVKPVLARPVSRRDRKTKHGIVAKKRKMTKPSVPKTALSMTITGSASTDVQVARFIANLAKHPLTELVDLVFSKEMKIGEETSRQYKVTVRLQPNADALDGIRQAGNPAADAAKTPSTQPVGERV